MDSKFTFLIGLGLCALVFVEADVAGYSSIGESLDASGYVFHDANANGVLDPEEEGIPNVLVSNGWGVTKTDEAGRYRLSVGSDTTVFVVKPSEWSVPLNESQLPEFYYAHKPLGSDPGLDYPGLEPTGPLPESIDFPLIPQASKDHFRVLVFGDPQPKNQLEIDYFNRDIIDRIAGRRDFDFGISLGDMVSDNLNDFESVNGSIARLGVPFYTVFGNHDMNFDVDEDMEADESFERVYGPTNYAFYYGKALFLILDNVIYPDERGTFIGGFREDQFVFLENLLERVSKDTLLVMCMHIPLFEAPTLGKTFRERDRNRLFALLEPFEHTFSLSAHVHGQSHHFFGADEGWLQAKPHHHYNVGTTSGSWWSGGLDERGIPHRLMHDGTPPGYAFLEIRGTDYRYTYEVAGSEKSTMRIYVPKVMRTSDYRTPVMANVYNATEKAVVEFRVIGDLAGSWSSMKRVETVDPHYMKLMLERDLDEEPEAGARLGYPSHSQHLWRGALPKSLEPGRYEVEVRWTDIFGREFTDAESCRVE